MRSLKLCLLAFLTSCMLDTINATTDFCPSDNTKVVDCDDLPDHKDDFKWTVASSFGYQKLVSETDDYVEIDMHRALYVAENPDDINTVKWSASKDNKDADQCKLYFERKNDNAYNSKAITSKDSNGQPIINIPTTFTKGFRTLVAVVDPKCRVRADKALFTKAKVFHVFLRNLKTEKLHNTVLKEIQGSQDTFNHGHFIYARRKIEGNVNPSIVADNSFFSPTKNSNDVECYHMCQYGNYFEYKVYEKGTSFANRFKLKADCEWMTIHFNFAKKEQSLEISLRHGFVKLPHEVKVHPMDFQVSQDDTYEVNVMYVRETDPKVPNSPETRRLDVTNSHGRAVSSRVMDANTGTIIFAFSHDDCLVKPIGSKFEEESVSGSNNKIFKPKGFEFAKGMNLAHKVAKEPNYEARRSAENGEGDALTKYDKSGVFDDITIDDNKGVIADLDHPVVWTTSTAAAIPANSSHAVKEGAPHGVMTKEEDDRRKAQEAREAAYRAKEKMYSEGSFYFTWGIPAGFAIGSFTSFLLCNVILFFFKRSVLTFWYKAMYKRYGSDTTMGAGTTMGKTMGGETIGGGTTMGGTTAGGETTGSTTAA